jgi:hypothetical protein
MTAQADYGSCLIFYVLGSLVIKENPKEQFKKESPNKIQMTQSIEASNK